MQVFNTSAPVNGRTLNDDDIDNEAGKHSQLGDIWRRLAGTSWP